MRNRRNKFLSTLSLRRATQAQSLKVAALSISIHALLAESDFDFDFMLFAIISISIHALLAESDICMKEVLTWVLISIHALLAESDWTVFFGHHYSFNFYPRSPCGERQRANRLAHAPPQISIHALLAESDEFRELLHPSCTAFLSTLSLRRATGKVYRRTVSLTFLSTLSLRRATHAPSHSLYLRNNFYPRSPCGERPHQRSNLHPS